VRALLAARARQALLGVVAEDGQVELGVAARGHLARVRKRAHRPVVPEALAARDDLCLKCVFVL
jgi:hypothetical protein